MEKRGVFVEVKNVIDIDIEEEEDVCDMPGIEDMEDEDEVVDMDMSIGIADVAIEVEVVVSGMSILTVVVGFTFENGSNAHRDCNCRIELTSPGLILFNSVDRPRCERHQHESK